jgi:flagellar FliL protein
VKADPKMKADGAEPKSKKKLMIIIAAVVLVVGAGGGGAAWFLTRGASAASGASASAEPEKKSHKAKKAEPPVFVPVEPFTVNLQQESGDQYLQTAFTLQVDHAEEAELIKTNMPQVRSRLLLLLSSKKASELTSTEGKKALSDEIITAVNQPFTPRGEPQDVTGVFFTSFIVQ